MDLPPVGIILIVLFLSIPILAIFASIIKEWFTMRGKLSAPAKTRELEEKLERLLDRAALQLKNLEKANKELEEKLKRLERTDADYDKRLENLEAIVVNQAWDESLKIIPTRPHEEATVEERNRERAADLARRLGG